MSVIHVNQIKTRISQLFEGKIDLTDCAVHASTHRENFFLTRSLAAYVIYDLGKTSADEAATSVVDGGDDNGIDAIYFDDAEKRMYLVQSKWIHDGRGEPSNGDVKKFADGVRDLFNLSFDRFNQKVAAKRSRIVAALNDANWTYSLVLAYTGINQLAEPSRRDLNDLANEMNDASEVVFVQTLTQAELHASLASSLAGAPITLDVTLYSWGKVEQPHSAFYGQVNAGEIWHWWEAHGPRLFAKNLRNVLGDTEVNEEIKRTIAITPGSFWYFNNGVTVVAASIAKTMAGGGDRDFGTFHCTDVSIVNGAQTVSTIGRHPTATAARLDQVRVPVRIISLEGCPATFGGDVTRANNRQNRIENRDFVSQDPVQIAVKRDLSIEGVDYNLVRSESFVPSATSFDLVESTTATVCASGKTALVVQLKREIGRLWENLERGPYKELFNENVNAIYVWRCVLVQRVVDRMLTNLASTLGSAGRRYGVAVHGNRMIALLALSRFPRRDLTEPTVHFEIEIHEESVKRSTEVAHRALADSVESLFPNAILPTLFKNAAKCKSLFEHASSQMGL